MSDSVKQIIKISSPVIGQEECRSVQETLLSGWITQGPKLRLFEQLFSTIHNSSFAMEYNSCKRAVYLFLNAMEILFRSVFRELKVIA